MSEDKKIIVDEDWKSQVEREKQVVDEPSENAEGSPIGPHEIPPASFPMLVTSLGTQAMMALGQVPDPMSGQPVYHPELARHHIDTLAVLQEKTAGNLTPDEKEMVDNFVVQLQQLYVAMESANSQLPPEPGIAMP